MAVVLMESFDKYPVGSGGIGGPEINVNGWICDENNGGIVSSFPRTGSRHIKSSAGDAVHKQLPASYTEIIYCAGVRFELGTAGNFFSLREASGDIHVILALDSGGHLIAKHGSGSPTYGTSTDVFQPDSWHWLEMRVKVDDSTGTLEVRVGGTTWIGPLTGLDTRNAGNGFIQVLWYDSSYASYADDVVVIDPSTGTPNDFIGDSRINLLLPSGNGTHSDWDGSDGNSVNNYQLVDEVPHTSDTDYVHSNVVGDKDSYAFDDTALSHGTVHAVQTVTVARKSTAGGRTIAALSRLAGGTEANSANFNLADSYQYHQSITHTKPGGGAWTKTDINGAEFGMEVT